MSYSWAGRRSAVPPNSSSQQKSTPAGNYAAFEPSSRFGERIRRLHNQACLRDNFSYSREVNGRDISPRRGGRASPKTMSRGRLARKTEELTCYAFQFLYPVLSAKQVNHFQIFLPPTIQCNTWCSAESKWKPDDITATVLLYVALFYLGRVKDPSRRVPEFEVNTSRFRSRPQELSVSFPRMTVTRRLLNANASSQLLFKHQRFSCNPKKKKKKKVMTGLPPPRGVRSYSTAVNFYFLTYRTWMQRTAMKVLFCFFQVLLHLRWKRFSFVCVFHQSTLKVKPKDERNKHFSKFINFSN